MQFEFRPGPIFANIVLADEINRATPKAQAAMLECMEESTITVDGITHELPQPFFVIATENPIEYEGTYSLPEAQLDRFLMRVSLGYPSPADEVDILSRQVKVHPIHRVKPVLTAAELVELQAAVRDVHVDDSLKEYAVNLVDRSRSHPSVELGASPRGSLALMRCGQAIAAIGGRDFVTPDDIKSVAHTVLGHRIIVKPDQRIRGIGSEQVVGDILRSVAVPVLAETV
jgi:MoxR-like ATPase